MINPGVLAATQTVTVIFFNARRRRVADIRHWQTTVLQIFMARGSEVLESTIVACNGSDPSRLASCAKSSVSPIRALGLSTCRPRL